MEDNGLKLTTFQSDTKPLSSLPIGPENESGLALTPSRCLKTCLRGSSFMCSKQIAHCNGLCSNSSKVAMLPWCLPVIMGVPSEPIVDKVFCRSVFSIAL